jgi:Ca-activated chloride channel homolog
MKTCMVSIVSAFLLLSWIPGHGQDIERLDRAGNEQRQLVGFWDKEPPKKGASYTLLGTWPPVGGDSRNQAVAENLLARNYVLVFDGSGSMVERKCSGGQRKIEVAKAAVTEWAKSIPENANVGLVAFHDNTFSRLPLSSKDRAEFLKRVNGINAGGGTPLAEAVNTARSMLLRQAQSQLGYGEYSIVVVTDGEASNPRALADAVATVLRASPIVIHTIGFCIDEKHSLNQPGRTLYKTADNPADLRKGLQEVLAEAETFDVSAFGR